MNTEQLNALKQAHLNGAKVQALVQFSVGFPPQWIDVADPLWYGGTEYRIKEIKHDYFT